MISPRFWSKPAFVEGIFVGALAVLCLGLTVLQYRWTGEVSRATTQTLRAGFGDQVPLLCRSFDADLTNACAQLLPGEGELSSGDREAVHLEHFQRWRATTPRPMFRRLAVAVPSGDGVDLLLLDLQKRRFAPSPWPIGWEKLRDNLSHKNKGGNSRPFQDKVGTLLEFPLFGRGGGESEWLILELDLDYVAKTWLPELVRSYLNRDGHALGEVTVRASADPSTLIYRTEPDGTARADGRAVTLRFNNQGGGTDDEGPPSKRGSWTLTAQPLPSALDAAVAAARWRNFVVSGLLIGLTLAAGLMLVRWTRRARRLAEAQMRFVAGVSHELRTPLTVIRGAAHNLGRGIVRRPAQIEQYARLILQHADQLGGMIEQVLELASRREGTRYVLKPVELPEVLREAIAATGADAMAARCRVQTEISPGLPPVQGDAGALRRVFQNLLVNAGKHGGAGGWIGVFADVAAGVTAPAVEVRVSDHGPGVPKDEQPRIFEPFFRGVDAQKRQTRGSGLGLSLVREIVEAHGGSVAVRSDSRRGATFVVRLPVAVIPAPGEAETVPAALAS